MELALMAALELVVVVVLLHALVHVNKVVWAVVQLLVCMNAIKPVGRHAMVVVQDPAKADVAMAVRAHVRARVLGLQMLFIVVQIVILFALTHVKTSVEPLVKLVVKQLVNLVVKAVLVHVVPAVQEVVVVDVVTVQLVVLVQYV